MSLPATWPIAIAVTGILAALPVLRRTTYGPLSPFSLYLFVWGSLVAVATLPIVDLTRIRTGTWLLLLVSSLGFCVGCIHGWFIEQLATRRGIRRVIAGATGAYDSVRLKRMHLFGCVALLSLLVLQIHRFGPYALDGWRAVLTGGEGLAFRRTYLEAGFRAAETTVDSGGLAQGLLTYALFAIGMQSVVWSGALARSGHRLQAMLPLLVMAGYAIVAVERSSFVNAFLIFLFSYYYHRQPRDPKAIYGHFASYNWRQIGTFGAVLITVFVMVYLPLKLRNPSLTVLGTTGSIVEYFTGPLGALNVFVSDNPRIVPPHLAWGTYSFWGAASVALRLGLPINLPPNWLDFVAYQTHGDRLSNVYTWLVYFILDFGWAGVVIVPYLLGCIASSLQYKVLALGRAAWIGTLAVLMTQIAMSFFAFSLIRDFRFVLFVVVSPWLAKLVRPPAAVRIPFYPSVTEVGV